RSGEMSEHVMDAPPGAQARLLPALGGQIGQRADERGPLGVEQAEGVLSRHAADSRQVRRRAQGAAERHRGDVIAGNDEAPWRTRGLRGGGSDRRRSGDLSIFSRTLYQLSYRAVVTR